MLRVVDGGQGGAQLGGTGGAGGDRQLTAHLFDSRADRSEPDAAPDIRAGDKIGRQAGAVVGCRSWAVTRTVPGVARACLIRFVTASVTIRWATTSTAAGRSARSPSNRRQLGTGHRSGGDQILQCGRRTPVRGGGGRNRSTRPPSCVTP